MTHMQSCTRRGGWGILLAALSLAMAATAAAVPYTFVNIADTNGPFANFLGGDVSLNAGGTVAFTAAGNGVFTGTGGAVTTVLDTSGPFSAIGGGTAINNAGRIAFQATLDGGAGSGIFVGAAGSPVATIAQSGGDFSAFGGAVAMNNLGTVAFIGNLTSGGTGVFSGDGGPPVAALTTPGTGITALGRPAINASGAVVFSTFADGGTPNDKGDDTAAILKWDAGTRTVIADTSGALSNVGVPAINAAGTVVFVGVEDGGTPNDTSDDSAAIYRWSSGTVTTVVDTSGQFKSFGALAINAKGTVFFAGLLDSGGFGYYTSDDLVNPIISFGDVLFGFPISGLDVFPAYNDPGQIAFTYFLRTGLGQEIRGIARADPLAAALPVPASIALVGIGLAALGGARLGRARG